MTQATPEFNPLTLWRHDAHGTTFRVAAQLHLTATKGPVGLKASAGALVTCKQAEADLIAHADQAIRGDCWLLQAVNGPHEWRLTATLEGWSPLSLADHLEQSRDTWPDLSTLNKEDYERTFRSPRQAGPEDSFPLPSTPEERAQAEQALESSRETLKKAHRHHDQISARVYRESQRFEAAEQRLLRLSVTTPQTLAEFLAVYRDAQRIGAPTDAWWTRLTRDMPGVVSIPQLPPSIRPTRDANPKLRRAEQRSAAALIQAMIEAAPDQGSARAREWPTTKDGLTRIGVMLPDLGLQYNFELISDGSRYQLLERGRGERWTTLEELWPVLESKGWNRDD